MFGPLRLIDNHDIKFLSFIGGFYVPNAYPAGMSKINPRKNSKEGGKVQESIQSSTTPDPRHHMEKRQKYKKTQHTRQPRGQPFSQQMITRLQGTEKTA